MNDSISDRLEDVIAVLYNLYRVLGMAEDSCIADETTLEGAGAQMHVARIVLDKAMTDIESIIHDIWAENESNSTSRITKAREGKGLSQEELASRCNLPLETLQAYENGIRTPRDSMKILIADALGVLVTDLFF